MSINSFGDLIFEIINLSPYELERANFIQHSERGAQPPHGYICPYCNSGNRDNRTGALDFDFKGDRWVHTCRVCSNGGDNATLFQFLFNANFKDALVSAADRFGIYIDDIDWSKEQKKVAKANKIFKPTVVRKKPIWPTRFTPPEQLPLIKKDIADAQKNLDNIPRDGNDRFAGGTFRGLKIDTLRHFGCGFLDKWAHPKNRLQGSLPFADPRVIIPTPDNEHYLALRPPLNRTGDKDKMHAGVLRIFNPDALKSDTVFLVEGEIDCMSVWQCSNGRIPCAAVISTGGGKSNLIPMIDAGVVTFRKFIILFDKDAGEKAAYELKAELDKRQFPAAVRFLFDFLSPDDRKKFGNKIDPNQFLCQKSGIDLQLILIKIRDDADKEFGDVEFQNKLDFRQQSPAQIPAQIPAPVAEQNQLAVTELNPATDSPTADKFAPLFDGLKPIRISPGAILYVANPDVKPALELLFVERNFSQFANEIAEYDEFDSDTNFYKAALIRLTEILYPYFYPQTKKLQSFIANLPAVKNNPNVAEIFNDDDFFTDAVDAVHLNFNGEPFSFDAQFRRKLIAFAKHSDDIFQSLLRYNYRLVENFLKNNFTDLLCAELLVHIQRDFIRFATDQATWYLWRNNRWATVTANSRAELYPLWAPIARKTRVFAEFEHFKTTCELTDFDIAHKDDSKKKNPAVTEKRKRLENALKNAKNKLRETANLESAGNANNFFAHTSGMPEVQITTNQFDNNPLLFNCANCTINLETLETYHAKQDDLITLGTDTVFNTEAHCDTWDKFLASAVPDLRMLDWLQRFFGYCLSGLTDEDIFVFINGIGGSGKTTFLTAISRALGDYAKTFDVNLITCNYKQKDGNEPNPALAALRACRLACSSETERDRRLDEAKIKLFTGGGRITARELHKPIFEFTPKFKMVIDGNYLLRISDINDRGLQRRLRIVPFEHPPNDNEVDIHLEDKLSTPEARSAILNWCIEGWQHYRQIGLRDTPAAMKSALNNFYRSNNIVADFLEDLDYQIDLAESESVKAVWNRFSNWQQKFARSANMSRKEFVQTFLATLKAQGVTLGRDKDRTDRFVGFKLGLESQPLSPNDMSPYDD